MLQEEAADDQLVLLETEAWVKKMRAPSARDFLALYHQLLEQVDLSDLHSAGTNIECKVSWDRNRRLGIAYLYRPDLNRLVLLEPLRQTDDVDALLEHHRHRLAQIADNGHDLGRVAVRSYPYLMVLDQDAWLAIQKDEESNLALSPEEAELLESIRRTGSGREVSYPLFINGRAGSGKSTMLQYLAADYVGFALRRDATRLPLYMTCSRDLLERARVTVRGLLTAHHARLLEGAPDASRLSAVLTRSFVVFHDFLYSLLPADKQRQLSPSRYVNYAMFRQLWMKDFARRSEARQMAPDVAWHTIRSYIKGIRSGHADELGPMEFAALPRRRRSVSEATYKRVYDRVWLSWYKKLCDEQGYWDDQDLAALVVETGVARTVDCAAVFCDEAQDFTAIELEIIFQLLLFARRSLQPEELGRVPIVFAGDPLQTINPTGFRWDAVQADFHDRFCAVLDPRRKIHMELSYRELRFNYRSNPGIVKFCNLIQLVRAALLGGQDIRPQEAWWVDLPVQTVWFALDNAQAKQQVHQRPELVKLVNCEEGEETEYVRGDPILGTLKEEAEGIYRNVLGPTRAKGLEFPAVVLYRFGETAPANFARLLDGELSLREQEERLPYDYFFNRLYVAASRAKGQLIVVDSGPALTEFWRLATDSDLIDRLMERTGAPGLWKDAVTFLVAGKEESWSGEPVDPREQAAEYANQGRRARDPYLLRQAALAYRSVGDGQESGKCLALAAEFEGKHREAGDRYRDLGLHEDAFRCYWEGRRWEQLCDLTAQASTFSTRLESRAADFMARSGSPHAGFIRAFVAAVGEHAWLRAAAGDSTWREIFGRLAERLSRTGGDKEIVSPDVYRAFRLLIDAGVSIGDAQMAALAYGAADYEEAVRLWDRSGTTDREEYRRAKARVARFPESLVWLGRLKEHNEVVRQWHEHEQELAVITALDDNVIEAVADAALEEGELPLAMQVLEVRPDRERVGRLLTAAVSSGEPEVVANAAVVGGRALVRLRLWRAAIRAAEEGDFSSFAGARAGEVRALLARTDGVSRVCKGVVEELAASDELASESADRQGAVAEFLYRHLIGRGAQAERHGIAPEIAGAAIERAGKIVDALEFYEGLLRERPSRQVERFAVERLVRNLERHAEYFRSRGEETPRLEREARARRIREQAGLGTRQFAEYPVVRTTSGIVPTEWSRGPFRIVLSRAHGRLRIEHTGRFETVTVDGRGDLRGDAEFLRETPGAEGAVSWRIVGWGMTVTLVRGDGVRAVLEFGEQRLEIVLVDAERRQSK